jgi:hypothetical protein
MNKTYDRTVLMFYQKSSAISRHLLRCCVPISSASLLPHTRTLNSTNSTRITYDNYSYSLLKVYNYSYTCHELIKLFLIYHTNKCKWKNSWITISMVPGYENKIVLKTFISDTQGHKTFKYEFCTHTPKSSNQNSLKIWDSLLIGCFFEYECKNRTRNVTNDEKSQNFSGKTSKLFYHMFLLIVYKMR